VVAFDGNPVYLSNSTPKDPGVTAMMTPYDEEVQKMYATIVGTTTVELPVDKGGEEICRTGECLLGDLVSDAILWELNSDHSSNQPLAATDVITPYQIALINGGMLRAPLNGSISVGDILDVLPFGNTIATFEITGTYMISAIESGLSKVGTTSGTGRFPQVAGLRYAFDPLQPVGSRLISVELQTETGYIPFNPALIYRVAANDYVRSGGDGYTVFRDHAINPYDFGPALDETLQDYIEELEVIHADDIPSGRILISYRSYLPWLFNNSHP
jgi:5'-nucleotidase